MWWSLLFWLALWALSHALAPSLLLGATHQLGHTEPSATFATKLARKLQQLPPPRMRMLRRLVRAQLYYPLAALLGVKLLVQCTSLHDLLHLYTPLHEAAFTAALAHWIVSLLEDLATPDAFVVPGLKLNLFGLYLVHHILAAAAFAYVIHTRQLSALAAMGLLFEAPVVFVNLRDLLRDFAAELGWFDDLGSTRKLQELWIWATIAIVPGRFGGIALWIFGLANWSHGLAHLPRQAQFAYLGFGGFFCGLSLMWAGYLMHMALVDGTYAREYDHAAKDGDEMEEARMSSSDGVNDAAVDNLSDVGSDAPLTGGKVDVRVVKAKEALAQLPVVSAEEFTVMGFDKERVILAIDGVVYDVTSFAAIHPGGEGALTRRIGTDASEAFASVGHSDNAKRMMEAYAIGRLTKMKGESIEERHERLEKVRDEEEIEEMFRGPYRFGRSTTTPKEWGMGIALGGYIELTLFQAIAVAMNLAIAYGTLWMLMVLRHPPAAAAPAAYALPAVGADGSLRSLLAKAAMDLRLPQLNCLLVGASLLSVSRLAHAIHLSTGGPVYRPSLSPRSHILALASLALVICATWVAGMGGGDGATAVGHRPHAASLVAAAFLMCPLVEATASHSLATARGLSALALAIGSASLADPFELLAALSAGSTAEVVSTDAAVAITLCAASLCQICALGWDASSAPPLHLAAVYLSASLYAVGAPCFASPLGIGRLAPATWHEGWWLLGSALYLINLFSSSPVRRVTRECMSEQRALVCAITAVLVARGRGEVGPYSQLLLLALILYHACNLFQVGKAKLQFTMTLEEARERAWLWGVLQNADLTRYLVASTVFQPLKWAVKLVASTLPDPLTFYVYKEAVAHYGDGVEMGVAYRVTPPVEQQSKPYTFVCNIGHLAHEWDWRRVGQSTLDMTKSLHTKKAAKAGFVGQYLAQFPTKQDGTKKVGWTQLNLTAWTSDEAAHEWYVNNKEHVRIVQQYRSGSLYTFSSMLARLRAERDKIFWQVRCRACHAVISGYPEKRYCTVCGQKAWAMPLI